MRIALGIEYAGTHFSGWQAQQEGTTVQGELEAVLSQIAAHSVRVQCAGRTDAGVHATGQVVHFDTEAIRPEKAWIAGSNALLPKTVVVKWMQYVDDQFHARFSALARRYCYVICNTEMHSAITVNRATWYRYPLNITLMQQGALALLGEQDFSSFRSAQCESSSPMRCMYSIEIVRKNEFVFIELEANAFLHRMVRNIAGVLLKVGAELKSPEWVSEVLLARDRRQAAETAPADGLYLVHVKYPVKYPFPAARNVLMF